MFDWVLNMYLCKYQGLRINVQKKKIIHCKYHDDRVNEDTGKIPCGICRFDIGRNSILCINWKKWTPRKCSNIKGERSQFCKQALH